MKDVDLSSVDHILTAAFYTRDTFHPARRLSAAESTYHNRWKQPIGKEHKT